MVAVQCAGGQIFCPVTIDRWEFRNLRLVFVIYSPIEKYFDVDGQSRIYAPLNGA